MNTFFRVVAEGIVARVKSHNVIHAIRDGHIYEGPHPITLRRLADHGIPPNLTIPYDSDELRTLVQELAQLEVD